MKRLILLLIIIVSIPEYCFALDISAKSACLIVADGCEIVYEKEPHIKLPMASTTKMMTALVAAESGKWDETVTVSVNAQNQEGSSIYLEENERIRLSELVCGMMLNSGNDAAVATAEHISGSTELFAQLMTKRANELGAINTRFENPSGLDDENHYSTAYDLAVIGSEVVKNNSLSPIIQCKEMKIENEDGDITYLRNHNKLLWRYDGVIGVKTGFTKKSGRCLVTAAERNGITLVAVTLSAPSDWNDHKLMLDYGFEVCEKSIELKKGDRVKKVQIDGDVLELVAAENIEVVNVKGTKEERELKIKTVDTIKAPVNAGEKLGVAELYQNNRLIARTDIVANKNIYETSGRRKNIIDTIKELLF